MTANKAVVIGAGLAGCEAAYQLARRGINVTLIEQKPNKLSPVHKSGLFAELVCSNSFRAEGLYNAVGLLQQEMRELDSLIIKAADHSRVPAGGALAVNRSQFAAFVTREIIEHKNIEVRREEAVKLPQDGVVIAAPGPLVEGTLADDIIKTVGKGMLSFYDAAAPIVMGETIDMSKAFYGSRYDKGGSDDYINCPMNEEQYRAFYEALVSAERAPLHGFEQGRVFEGCMPVEVMAGRGFQTLLFGPLKPVGLRAPGSDERPFAVVQLRREDKEGRLYNLVGFQTNLKFGEQLRVFQMIPGLENAEFVRFGVMHKNAFLASPGLLNNNYELTKRPGLFFAGQITGVEGYVESASSGLLAGLFAACDLLGQSRPSFSRNTACGALAAYVSDYAGGDFQPMNITFGIMNTLETRAKGKDKKRETSERALEEIQRIAQSLKVKETTT